MSKFKTKRDSNVQELIPVLVKCISNCPEHDPRFRRMVDNARILIRNQSELDVNGHEVQRRMDDLCETFAVCNYQVYSDLLKQWKDSIASHPKIANSDQSDIHWGIMQLLLDVARSPVEAITDRVIRNQGKLVEFPLALDEQEPSTHDALIESLLEANDVSEEESHHPISDELSDWSDETDEEEGAKIESVESKCVSMVAEIKSVAFPANIKPPQKEQHFKELNYSDSWDWLKNTAQHSWWKQDKSKAVGNSDFIAANFAEEWNKYLDTLSMGTISDKDLSTTSEYILIREIIWMLVAPAQNCKYFRMDENSKIVLNGNVTITSCSLPIMQSFLRKITTSMSNLLELRKFTGNKDPQPSVYNIYSACLLEHIHALERYCLERESRIMAKNDDLTSLAFIQDLGDKYLRVSDALHRIHCEVIMPERQNVPNFILASYFLTKLWHKLDCPLDPIEHHLTVSILVHSLQSFLCVFDSWWSLGQLFDYTEEFLITPWGEVRDFPVTSKRMILSCPLIRFLLQQLQESNIVLSHLNSIHRINILSEVGVEFVSYREFLKNLLVPFKIPPRQIEETQTESPPPTNEYYCELMELLQLEAQVEMDIQHENRDVLSAKELFDLFQQSNKNCLLPFQQMIIHSLGDVIKPRIEATHQKLARIFLDEYRIINHFRNVNSVLLLQSPSMYEFNTDLFENMEEEYNNLSSYQLTAKLDACLNQVHPQMESMFVVHLDQRYYKTELDTILDCLTKVRIEYNFHAGEGVIDFNAQPIYNRAFSFLLQIKWALWLLENLKYGEHLVRVKYFKEPNVLNFSIRRMGILRFWLLSSIKNIHSYLMHDVIECETIDLERELGKCKSIAEIQKCHEKFLKDIEEKCFLTERQEKLHKAFQEFLHYILIFRDYWMQLQGIADTDYRLEKKESKLALLDIKIDQLEGTYSKIHACLIEKLQEDSKDHIGGHVIGLMEAFVYKQPTIHKTKA